MTKAKEQRAAPGKTGCAAPKMTRKRRDCGCTSEWHCEACGYVDRRREDEHEERCRGAR